MLANFQFADTVKRAALEVVVVAALVPSLSPADVLAVELQQATPGTIDGAAKGGVGGMAVVGEDAGRDLNKVSLGMYGYDLQAYNKTKLSFVGSSYHRNPDNPGCVSTQKKLKIDVQPRTVADDYMQLATQWPGKKCKGGKTPTDGQHTLKWCQQRCNEDQYCRSFDHHYTKKAIWDVNGKIRTNCIGEGCFVWSSCSFYKERCDPCASTLGTLGGLVDVERDFSTDAISGGDHYVAAKNYYACLLIGHNSTDSFCEDAYIDNGCVWNALNSTTGACRPPCGNEYLSNRNETDGSCTCDIGKHFIPQNEGCVCEKGYAKTSDGTCVECHGDGVCNNKCFPGSQVLSMDGTECLTLCPGSQKKNNDGQCECKTEAGFNGYGVKNDATCVCRGTDECPECDTLSLNGTWCVDVCPLTQKKKQPLAV